MKNLCVKHIAYRANYRGSVEAGRSYSRRHPQTMIIVWESADPTRCPCCTHGSRVLARFEQGKVTSD